MHIIQISALRSWVIGSSLPSDLNMSAQAIDVSSCLNVDSSGGPSCGALSRFSERFIHRGSISDGIPSSNSGPLSLRYSSSNSSYDENRFCERAVMEVMLQKLCVFIEVIPMTCFHF